MSIRVTQIAVGGFDENLSYLVHDLETKKGFIIDPSGTYARIAHAVATLQVDVIGIILTHSHQDHWDALTDALASFPVAVVHAHESIAVALPCDVTTFADGDSLPLGSGRIDVIYTPGHTQDSVVLFIAPSAEYPPLLISGDTVFIDGCGRILPDQAETMFSSLQRIKTLPNETIIYPGHDYGELMTGTLGAQLVTNRFLNTDDLAVFTQRRFPQGGVQ